MLQAAYVFQIDMIKLSITFLRFGKFGKPLSEVSPLLLSVSVSRLVYSSVSPAI